MVNYCKKYMFYFEPIIILDVRRGSYFGSSWTVFSVSDTTRCEDLVLKIKSVLCQIWSIQSDKVHYYKHSERYLSHLKWKLNIWEIFHCLQFFERFFVMENWQICEAKIINWYMVFRIKTYITWKRIISSYKIRFQNYGQLKRKFLRPGIAGSTLVKFELSSYGSLTEKWEIFEQQCVVGTCYRALAHIYNTISLGFYSFSARNKGF